MIWDASKQFNKVLMWTYPWRSPLAMLFLWKLLTMLAAVIELQQKNYAFFLSCWHKMTWKGVI